jgi:hypothetical protein
MGYSIMKVSLFISVLVASVSLWAESGMVLAHRGEAADCAIVVANDADESVRYAARELRDFTKRMTGVELKVSEGVPNGKAVILGVDRTVGDCEDSFRLKVKDGRLYVTGGGSRGVLYGVYELLERFGGCEWFAPWCENIPSKREFSVPDDLDVFEKPAFIHRNASWRQVHTRRDRASRDFAARMRFTANSEPKYGGLGMKFVRKLGSCHTFYTLVPPKEHFAAHPEWFSEIKGRRTGERAQLCLSNTELVKFVAEEIKRRLRDEPTAQMVGVSQNDWNNYCQCSECSKCAKEEGSQAGPNLKFVNAVAEEIEKEFPHIIVETLAYQYTRRPPKNIRPRHNVAVCLCSFECSFSVPFTESKHVNTVGFVENIRAWGKICRNLMIYDYCTNFRNYLSPFPNVYSLAPNYRLFKECGTRWLYSQGGGDGFHAEFAELKCYLQSKLMWNPEQSVEPIIDGFMEGYYGAASRLVKRYFDELYSEFGIKKAGNDICDSYPSGVGIYSENQPQLTDEKLKHWTELWREAEELVKYDPIRSYNVRMSALSVLYTRLKRAYERKYKTVWAAENLTPHIAGMESLRSLAAEIVARRAEARKLGRGISFAENYKTRHLVLVNHFEGLSKWVPPAQPSVRTEISTNIMTYFSSDRLWQFPIREIAVDEGAKYRVRVRLRPKAKVEKRFCAEDKYGFAAGLQVRWLPQSKGRKRMEVPREKVSVDWAWYDIGEYDFSELQKIPLSTMDGLCLFVQGDVDLDRFEIARCD